MSVLSPSLRKRIMRSEGYRSRPYLCPAGKVTIGFGTNLEANPAPIRTVSEPLYRTARRGELQGGPLLDALLAAGMEWDRTTAAFYLEQEVDSLIASLAASCPAFNVLMACPAPEGQKRASVLVDMAYNMGLQGLLGFRRMLAATESGDYARAAAEMLDSRWAAQVGNRARELARIMREGR